MARPYIVGLDNMPLRFTPDGRVSVVDAIRAVGDVNYPTSIWEHLKKAHPDILSHCEDYSFQGNDPVAVIDSKGWEKVWFLLPDYLEDPDIIEHRQDWMSEMDQLKAGMCNPPEILQELRREKRKRKWTSS